jgi:SH3 domain-containing YSC84-like protein 1
MLVFTHGRFVALIMLGIVTSAANAFAVNPDRKVRAAAEVLREMMNSPAKGIPRSMLEDAEGVVIIPEVIKVGFVIGVQRGEGVALVRDANRAWQPPKFVTITAGSVGWQIGAESSDFVLVFKTRKGVDGLMSGKFTIGADANAAIGPVGRQIGAATDAKLSAEIYTYSRSRGLFAGVSLAGSSLDIDPVAEANYYGTALGAPPVGIPESAMQLVGLLTQITDSDQVIGATNDVVAAPNGTLEQEREAILANARALGPALNDQWRQYLALPDELSTPGRVPDPKAMRKVTDRFQAVARDPKYRALNQRPEFTATRDALDRYYKSLTAVNAAPLNLPAPPPGVN